MSPWKQIIALLVIALTACTSASQPTSPTGSVTPETEGTLEALETASDPPPAMPRPSSTGTAFNPVASVTPTPLSPTPTSEAPALPIPQYIISATLDYPLRRLSVQQEITYPNVSQDIISDLILVVEPNRFPGAFTVKELSYADGSEVYGYRINGIQMRVPLVEPLLAGGTLRLTLKYQLSLPELTPSDVVGPNPFGYTSRQVNVVDWYPFVPPRTSDGEWLVHDPWYYGEHLVYPVSDIDVRIRLFNAPERLQIAASALPKMEGEWRRYRLERARNLVLSMSPDYVVLEETVGEVKVLGYAFPTDVQAGEAAFQATIEALQLYSQLYGAYPWESLSLVEADFLHGMEYQGLHYLSRGFYNLYTGTPRDYLTAIAAHETAHQWWYGLVGNDQASEPWLDEALCTYSERLFYEKVHPEDLDWWWEARVDFYKPEGKVNSTLYDTGGYRPYVNAVYLRGGLFFEDLRALMGDEAFFRFLKDYAQKNRGQLATSAGFFNLLSDYTEENLSGLLGEYFK